MEYVTLSPLMWTIVGVDITLKIALIALYLQSKLTSLPTEKTVA